MVEGVLERTELALAEGGLTMVVAGASLGTLFEWYDFFLYGSLAGEIARHFFAAVDERAAFVFALAAFAACFIARPFGALVFGRVGDLVGRKNTFLVTMTIMGLSTPHSAVLSAVIFNALIIIALIPLALRGVKYRPIGAGPLLRRNLLIYGIGGIIAPFIFIKLIDLILVALHLTLG